eukprot:Gregarina_sp_Pseudo_9__5860@NODE_90_length_4362_cov_16_565811_g82_i0_p1_GENE_NODE_90_length_4362_cov_16_565811_g82_i0NODE_90_length_4362_cov_16_565811_g82_i0_p1_ORF_typecomplete_len630_score234_23FAD_binding_4/PF01565_23/5_6e33FAD_binding_4/PF01565_23/5_9e02BBE/PF08031_12/1_2e12ALO/PF04030_14/0_1_NODE_90_length_4362_cov_16_565811_g82_i022614150
MPIVEYPTFPPLLSATETLAPLAPLPPRPDVPGMGVQSRRLAAEGDTSPAKGDAVSSAGFLSRTPSPAAPVASPVAEEEECSAEEEECELAPSRETETQGAGDRWSFYECLFERLSAERVLVPSSAGYRLATVPYNLARPTASPVAIVFANSSAQAAAAVSCAQRHQIKLVPRSGGHDYASFSFGTSDSAVIDVSEISHIEVDAETETARIGPGARLGNIWFRVFTETDQKFLLPLGACTSVGFGGHVLGGGYGFFARAYGMASDYMLEAEVVLANGTVVRAKYSASDDSSGDADADASLGDLFWALRGSGTGHFGVVTDFVFRLVPAPPSWTAASLVWLGRDSHLQVLSAFVDWADEAAPGLAASFAVIPNRTVVQAAYPGTLAQFWTAIDPLLKRLNETGDGSGGDGSGGDGDGSGGDGSPLEMMPFIRQGNWLEVAAELSIMHMNDVNQLVAIPPVRKVPSVSWLNDTLLPIRSRFQAHSAFWALDNELTPETVNVLNEILEHAPPEYAYTLELMGGQESRVNAPVDAGYPHRQVQFILHMYIRAEEPFNPHIEYNYALRAYYDKLLPRASPLVYANYHDNSLGANASKYYYSQNLPRLRQIKLKYDPDTLFWFPQVIRPQGHTDD